MRFKHEEALEHSCRGDRNSHAQPMPSLHLLTRDHTPSRLGPHPHQESVRVVPTHLGWLVRPLVGLHRTCRTTQRCRVKRTQNEGERS